MKELKSNAKILDKVCRILKIGIDIALVTSLVCLGILAVGLIFDLRPEQIGTGFENLELGFIKLTLSEEYVPDKNAILLHAGAELLVGLVYIWAARIAVKCVREILKPMAAGEPFGGVVSAKLNQLSLLSLLLGIIANGIQLISQAMTAGGYDLVNLLLSEKIAGVSLAYKADLTFLLVFAVLKLLTYVFRYGEELQKLSDETL